MSGNEGFFGSMGGGLQGDITDGDGNALLGTDNQTQPFGPALRRSIRSGVPNGDFYLAPPSPDSEITTDNLLPYWTLTRAQGTQVQFSSVEDASAGSGRVIRIYVTSTAAASDETYIEQLVPINSARGQAYAYAVRATFLTPSASGSSTAKLVTQFLDVDEVALGSPTTTSVAFSSITGPYDLGPTSAPFDATPTNAYWLRIRVGVVAQANANAYVDLTEVRLLEATDWIGVVDASTPSNARAELRKFSGTTTLTNGGSNVAKLTLSSAGATLVADGASPATVNTTGQTTTLAGPGGGVGASVALTETRLILTPGAVTIDAVGDTIAVGAKVLVDITVTGGPFTLTSTPTIADGADGQVIILQNVSGNAVVLQDQGTLGGSNLRLTATTVSLSVRDSVILRYSSTIGDWVQIGPLVNVL